MHLVLNTVTRVSRKPQRSNTESKLIKFADSQNKLVFSSYNKQAQKSFRPPSAMKGIGYFQNHRIFLRIFLEFFGNFLGGFFLEDFFGRIVFGEILCFILMQKKLICLSRFWFLSRFCLKARKEGRKEEFRSLEVRLQVHRT